MPNTGKNDFSSPVIIYSACKPRNWHLLKILTFENRASQRSSVYGTLCFMEDQILKNVFNLCLLLYQDDVRNLKIWIRFKPTKPFLGYKLGSTANTALFLAVLLRPKNSSLDFQLMYSFGFLESNKCENQHQI